MGAAPRLRVSVSPGQSPHRATASKLPAPAGETKGNIMTKNMDTKKDSKKKPAKSLKEKRAEKKTKKETKK